MVFFLLLTGTFISLKPIILKENSSKTHGFKSMYFLKPLHMIYFRLFGVIIEPADGHAQVWSPEVNYKKLSYVLYIILLEYI